MKTLASAALAAGFLLTTIAPASAATVFLDAAAFGAATSNVTIETFDTRIPGKGPFDANTPITFDNGTTSAVTTLDQFNEVRSDGTFIGGTRRGRTAEFDRTVTFDFGRSITAFGGDFTGIEGVVISGLFDGTGESIALDAVLGASSGFFGLTSTTELSTVTFSTTKGSFLPFGNPTVSIQAINFGLDNLALGDAATAIAPVPLPASALLLVAGLGALSALRRNRRQA